MLTMTQVHNIRKLYFEEGKNINQTSKETGFDRKTVRNFLNKENFNTVKDTVDKRFDLKDYDFYFDYIIDICNKIISLLDKKYSIS